MTALIRQPLKPHVKARDFEDALLYGCDPRLTLHFAFNSHPRLHDTRVRLKLVEFTSGQVALGSAQALSAEE